jgi:hypothetical protein
VEKFPKMNVTAIILGPNAVENSVIESFELPGGVFMSGFERHLTTKATKLHEEP